MAILMMKKRSKFLFASSLIIVFSLILWIFWGNAALAKIFRLELKSKAVATVNEDRISADYLEFIAGFPRADETLDYQKLVDQAIDISAFSQTAAKYGLNNLPEVKNAIRQSQLHFIIKYVMKAERKQYEPNERQKAELQFLQSQTYGKAIQLAALNYENLSKEGPISESQKKSVIAASLEDINVSLDDVFALFGAYGEAIFMALDEAQKQEYIFRTLQLKILEKKFEQVSAAEKPLIDEVFKRIQQSVEAKEYLLFLQGKEYQTDIRIPENGRKPFQIMVQQSEINDFYQRNPNLFTSGTKKLLSTDPKVKSIAEQNLRIEKFNNLIQSELTLLRKNFAIKKYDEVIAELEKGE
jgi:hypothetical protein